MGALGCVAEQPVFATDDERADGTFGWVVVDRQVAAFQVADQPGPVVGQVADSLTQRTLRCDVRLCLVQPAFQLLQDRLAFLLPDLPAHAVVRMLALTLYAIQFVDQVQGHVGTTGLAPGLSLLRLNELASSMGPASQTLNAFHSSDAVVTGIIIRHQVALIACEQAQWHFLRSAGPLWQDSCHPLISTR